MRPTSFPVVILAGLSLAVLGGCGGPANKLGTAAAGGAVTYRGAPLAGATVTLAPQQGQRPAVGPKNLATMSVEEMRAYEAEMMKGPPDFQEPEQFLPEKYRSAATTPFSCEVKTTGDNEFVFELTD